MTAGLVTPAMPPAADPLTVLREYRTLAPWGLRDLAAVAAAVLEASGVVPVNAAARARPTERTIRFYVTRGLVSAPEGRGTAAVYGYRHLLQVLAIKLRQMEGATLETLSARVRRDDRRHHRAARGGGAGHGAAAARRLPLLRPAGHARGKVGRAMQRGSRARYRARSAAATAVASPWRPASSSWSTSSIRCCARPAAMAAIAETVRQALARLVTGE